MNEITDDKAFIGIGLESARNSVGPGWRHIIDVLWFAAVYYFGDMIISQVKEKFGGLRFYTYGGPPEWWDLEGIMVSWSEKTCENCGRPGERRPGGWIKTLCDDCHENLIKQRPLA